MTRVAVLHGGPSSEHAISVESGLQVATKMPPRFQAIPVLIEKSGPWVFGTERVAALGAALDHLKAVSDVVFPALHGAFGEDGTLQALLEASSIPFVGSRTAASAFAMDKGRAKAIYRDAGIPTPAGVRFQPGDDVASRYPEDGSWVVKPSHSGSSVGIVFPQTRGAGITKVEQFLDEGRDVLVEEVVRGTELTCGTLSFRGRVKPLPVTEVAPDQKYDFFDYEAKYTPGATREITPAQIPDSVRETTQSMALACHRALGCRHLSRTDFILKEGEPLALETNTMPGFTETSLLPQAALVEGLSFSELIGHLIDEALQGE